MDNDFRRRALLPALLPLVILVGFVGTAFALSRVLLHVTANQATFLALLAASYILLIAGLVAARPRISSRALSVGLVIAVLAVGVAGTVAGAAGTRELHQWDEHPEEHAADHESEEGEEGAVEIAPDALVFVAIDLDFADAPATAPAGEATIAIDNQGAIVHDVTIDELGIHVGAGGGEVAQETVALEPGTYTYYCSVPGHRAAGMEGTIEVS